MYQCIVSGVFDDQYPERLLRVSRPCNGRRHIKHQPVDTQLTHCLHELIKVYRFANIAVRTKIIAGDNISLFIGRCQYHYRQAAG